jgi:acyl-CoA-binding protein
MKLTRTASAADVMLASQPADFRLAAAYVIAHKQAIPMTQRLVLYALYKQAIDGDAPETAERWAQIIELAKHAVWSRYRGMSADEARKKWALSPRPQPRLAASIMPPRHAHTDPRPLPAAPPPLPSGMSIWSTS